MRENAGIPGAAAIVGMRGDTGAAGCANDVVGTLLRPPKTSDKVNRHGRWADVDLEDATVDSGASTADYGAAGRTSDGQSLDEASEVRHAPEEIACQHEASVTELHKLARAGETIRAAARETRKNIAALGVRVEYARREVADITSSLSWHYRVTGRKL